MKVSSKTCLKGGVVSGYRLNVSGQLISRDHVNNFFEQRLAERLLWFRTIGLQRSGELQIATAGSVSVGPDRFIVSEAGTNCSKECKDNTYLCTRLKLDKNNSTRVAQLISELPNQPMVKNISSADVRNKLGGTDTCDRGNIEIQQTTVVNSGKSCSEPLELNMTGTPDLQVTVDLPKQLSSSITYSGAWRELRFSDPDKMLRLRLAPTAAQQLVGGKIREVHLSLHEIVAEAQNGCLAISLGQ